LKLFIIKLYSGVEKEVIVMPNQQQLIKAALIVAGFGIVILSLTYVVPLLGILGAGAIIVAGIYAIYLFLTGKLKI
jgi:hypothetical protein